MKIRQKLFLFLAIILGILFVGIGKTQAASLVLSPDSGLAGSSFTISGSGFTSGQSVTAQWDSTELDVSSTSPNESGDYSSPAQVPAGASVGLHTVVITGPGSIQYNYEPKNWLARIFPRALAADGDIIASVTFTVTAPPVTPPVVVTPPAETPVADTTTAPASTSTTNTAPLPANSNPATAEPVAPTVSTDKPEPIIQTKSTNEAKEEAKVCYFPWWLWLVLILITVVNLALFWLRYWKKKPEKKEQ